jgi:hypothetical protein
MVTSPSSVELARACLGPPPVPVVASEGVGHLVHGVLGRALGLFDASSSSVPPTSPTSTRFPPASRPRLAAEARLRPRATLLARTVSGKIARSDSAVDKQTVKGTKERHGAARDAGEL